MAAPVHATLSGDKARRPLGERLGSWVSTKGCFHALKLRHSVKVDPRTRMELGLDLEIVEGHHLKDMLKNASPWAAVLHQLDEFDAGKGAIEVNPLFVTWNRKWRLGREGAWWEVPLDTKLGLTYTGQPHVEVGVGNAKLALALAAVLLAAGKTVSVKRKEVGSLAVHFPITANGVKYNHSLQERLEIDASLRAEGRGLKLDFQQLSGVLRLQQD